MREETERKLNRERQSEREWGIFVFDRGEGISFAAIDDRMDFCRGRTGKGAGKRGETSECEEARTLLDHSPKA